MNSGTFVNGVVIVGMVVIGGTLENRMVPWRVEWYTG